MGPSRTAELYMVSMTTADSSVVGHFCLPLRIAGDCGYLLMHLFLWTLKSPVTAVISADTQCCHKKQTSTRRGHLISVTQRKTCKAGVSWVPKIGSAPLSQLSSKSPSFLESK